MAGLTPSKCLIVYIDDDVDDLDLLSSALSPYGDSVTLKLYNHSGEGYRYLEESLTAPSLPCLIILDMNMPGLSGKELLKDLRKSARFDEVPIVLFTTSNERHDQEFAESYRAAFITKPISVDQVEEITKQFVAMCREKCREKI